jgi:hypothetical protein
MTALPDSIISELNDLKRRVRELETAPRITNTSQRGGTFRLIANDGDPTLFNFGGFTDADNNEQYGIAVNDRDGNALIATGENDQGLLVPAFTAAFADASPRSITSATYDPANTSEVLVPLLVHDTVSFNAALIVPAGTNAEVRVQELLTAQAWTVAVPGPYNGNVYLRWLHPFGIGWSDLSTNLPEYQMFLQYSVRRTAGAGTVTAYRPRSLMMCNHRFAYNGVGTPPSAIAPLSV